MTSLSRADVLAIAAHVQAGNVDGCAEDLLVKLRALWKFVDADGLRLGGRFCGMCGERIAAPKHEPGAPDTVVVDPTISAEAGDGGHAAQGDPASLPTLGPETALSPAAADSRSTGTQRGEKPSTCGSDVGGCSSDDTASYRLGSTSSAEAGDAAHSPVPQQAEDQDRPSPGSSRFESERGSATTASPASVDSPITVADGRVALRTETIDAIFSGGTGMPEPAEQLNKRRRARTRAV